MIFQDFGESAPPPTYLYQNLKRCYKINNLTHEWKCSVKATSLGRKLILRCSDFFKSCDMIFRDLLGYPRIESEVFEAMNQIALVTSYSWDLFPPILISRFMLRGLPHFICGDQQNPLVIISDCLTISDDFFIKIFVKNFC